jgi:peroxiredoxin
MRSVEPNPLKTLGFFMNVDAVTVGIYEPYSISLLWSALSTYFSRSRKTDVTPDVDTKVCMTSVKPSALECRQYSRPRQDYHSFVFHSFSFH